jgi:hypothetical protein
MTSRPEPSEVEDPTSAEEAEPRPSRAERRRGAAAGSEPPAWQAGRGKGGKSANIAAPRHYNRHR